MPRLLVDLTQATFLSGAGVGTDAVVLAATVVFLGRPRFLGPPPFFAVLAGLLLMLRCLRSFAAGSAAADDAGGR